MEKLNLLCAPRRWPCSPTGWIYEAGGCGHGISTKLEILSYIAGMERAAYFMSEENWQKQLRKRAEITVVFMGKPSSSIPHEIPRG